MNGFVPALVAMLLAELGPRAILHRCAPRPQLRVLIMAMLIAAGAIAGAAAGDRMSSWADTLMIGLALGFAGIGQWQRIAPATTALQALWRFWGGGTLLITFALAARFGAVAVIAGAVGGLVAAVAIGINRGDLTWPRRAAALALTGTGMVAAVVGLRLA